MMPCQVENIRKPMKEIKEQSKTTSIDEDPNEYVKTKGINNRNRFLLFRNKNKLLYKETSSTNFFKGHQCYLSREKLTEYGIKCNSIRKFWLFVMALNKSDIRAKTLYRSYAALCAEKYHQYKFYPFTIHPFSLYRYWLESFTVAVISVSSTVIGIYFSSRAEPVIKYAVCFSDIVYLVNIASNFLTGYVEGDTSQYVVLELKRIIFRYLSFWFFVDLLSCSGLIFLNGSKNTSVIVVLIALKTLRWPAYCRYLANVLTVNKIGLIITTAIQVFFLVKSYLDWNIYFQFGIDYFHEDSFYPVNPRNCSWITIAKLWNETAGVRYVYALDRAVGMFRSNSNLSLMEHDGCFEIFFIIAWIFGKGIFIHCLLKFIIALSASESAQAKYFMMANQVETYLKQRQLPPRMKKKILKFYAIKFQSHFFVESRMLACMSGQLREDIILHTGRQLVNHVAFLKELPRGLLLQIEIRMKTAIFIEGDIIFKINTVGDCLYFIDKGTVAIYSESGKEICHLEDGDYFGEIALVMKHRFRNASAVAVTNCELFRLDKEDFESSIACYPTVYEDIKKVATNRYERTCIVDEHHKTDLKNN